MTTTRILLIEDDDRIRQALSMALEDDGYDVAAVGTAEEGVKRHAEDPFSAALVDLMLPGMDGFECIRELRRLGDVPVIVVSAKDDTHDIVAALEAGADDYVVKPVRVKELTARIRALRRRATTEPTSMTEIRFGDTVLLPGAGEAQRDGKDLALTRTEFRLLCELASHRGQVLSRAQLLSRVWEYDFGDERLVDVHVGRLRRKVEADPSDPQHLVTVRGLGYKLR